MFEQLTPEEREKIDVISEQDMLNLYDEFLDEMYGVIQIGVLEYTASHVLKNVDETAYRCGFSDWTDSMRDEYEEYHGDYYSVRQIEEQLEQREDNNE